MSTALIVLVHGFNKDRDDMCFLQEQLSSLGFEVLSVDLPTTFGTIEDSVNSLYLQIWHEVSDGRPVSFVAHSMGGLIVRSFSDKFHQINFKKLVFIATPHGGSKLADIANNIPGYSFVFKPIKDLLSDVKYPTFPIARRFNVGIIAGDKNRGILGGLFLSPESDGRVEVSSARASDVDDFIVVPFAHKEIHQQPLTAKLVAHFLKYGNFNIKASD